MAQPTDGRPAGAQTLMLRPEDLLHACVAYTRPEMHTLNHIIALRSKGTLAVHASSPHRATLAALPPEVLLRVRAELQAALVRAAAAETTRALDEYEGALVDGLCADCFWWNHDIYGEDVWAWVENGYREACKCCVADAGEDDDVHNRAANNSMRKASVNTTSNITNNTIANSSSNSNPGACALVSAEKARVARKYAGLEIYSRRQWLDAHIARTYLPAASAARAHAQPWRGLVRAVLAGLGCACSVELEEPYDPSLGPAFASRYMERKRALQCSFGLPVAVVVDADADGDVDGDVDGPPPADASAPQVRSRSRRRPDADPAVTLARVVRELQVRPPSDDDAPFARLEGSSLRFTHKLQSKLCKPSEHYFRVEWHPSCNCMDCLLNLYPRAPPSLQTTDDDNSSSSSTVHADASSGMLAPVCRVLTEVSDRGTALLSSGFTCGMTICALLLYRMLPAPPAALV